MSQKYECHCNNCNYVSKSEVKEYKAIMEKAITQVRNDLKKKYKRSCNSMLVGSAKRNLVVQKGASHWDVDYQFLFTSPVYDDKGEVKPYDLKPFIRDRFKKHLGEDYSVKMSTSVITICLMADKDKHAIKSFDVALIRKSDHKILRGKNNDSVKWEFFSDTDQKFYKKIKEINGVKDWTNFRKIFIKKKCKNMKEKKENQRATSSLYLETIQDTLDQKNKN